MSEKITILDYEKIEEEIKEFEMRIFEKDEELSSLHEGCEHTIYMIDGSFKKCLLCGHKSILHSDRNNEHFFIDMTHYKEGLRYNFDAKFKKFKEKAKDILIENPNISFEELENELNNYFTNENLEFEKLNKKVNKGSARS